jgi:hypothetical protein
VTDVSPPEPAGSELATLQAFIVYLRGALRRKVEGLTDEQARQVGVPSGTSLLGLLKHTAAVETFWLHHAFAGMPRDVIVDDELSPSDTIASVMALQARVALISDGIVAAATDPAALAAEAPFGPPLRPLRWILVHLVEELGRHAGHADILREQLDGTVGR